MKNLKNAVGAGGWANPSVFSLNKCAVLSRARPTIPSQNGMCKYLAAKTMNEPKTRCCYCKLLHKRGVGAHEERNGVTILGRRNAGSAFNRSKVLEGAPATCKIACCAKNKWDGSGIMGREGGGEGG